MADDETTTKSPNDAAPLEGEVMSPDALEQIGGSEADDWAPATLGSAKYVHASFFSVGVVVAFVSGKILAGVWNALAAWAPAVRTVPQLLLYGEDERPRFTFVVGVILAGVIVFRMFRSAGVRKWADDVALELSKVVWPSRETVRNGTIVVVVASALATVYVGLLDRLWGFVTHLVYGA
jgi:preprotein translocase subunit SecE